MSYERPKPHYNIHVHVHMYTLALSDAFHNHNFSSKLHVYLYMYIYIKYIEKTTVWLIYSFVLIPRIAAPRLKTILRAYTDGQKKARPRNRCCLTVLHVASLT